MQNGLGLSDVMSDNPPAEVPLTIFLVVLVAKDVVTKLKGIHIVIDGNSTTVLAPRFPGAHKAVIVSIPSLEYPIY